MAVKIRLLRMGRRKRPFYRIVAADSRTKRDGSYLENLGYYDPIPNPAVLKVEKERIFYWLEKGAIPTETVANLLKREGITLEWHLIKNKVDAQKRNIELQKWELLKKGQIYKVEEKPEKPKEAGEAPTPAPEENITQE